MSSRCSMLRVRAGRGDLLVQHRVEHIALAPVHLDQLVPARAALDRGVVEGDRGRGQVEHRVKDRSQSVAHAGVRDPEDGVEDHVERQALRDLDHGHLGSRGPRVELVLHEPLHQPRVATHPFAVERWRQQLAAGEVLGRLEQQQRPVAEGFAQQVVGVSFRRRLAGQQAADHVAVDRDDALRKAADLGAEVRAVAIVSPLGELPVPIRPQVRLHPGRERGPGGKRSFTRVKLRLAGRVHNMATISTMAARPELWVCHLGTLDYREALGLQERVRAARQQELCPT